MEAMGLSHEAGTANGGGVWGAGTVRSTGTEMDMKP